MPDLKFRGAKLVFGALIPLVFARSALSAQQAECGQDTTASIRVRLKDYLNIPANEVVKAVPRVDQISNLFSRMTSGSKGLLIQEYRSYGSSGEPRRVDLVYRVARLQCERGRPTAKHTGLFLFHITFAVNSVNPVLTETALGSDGSPYYNVLDSLAEPSTAALHTRSANVDRVRGRVENWLITRDGTPPWRVATRQEILEWNMRGATAFASELNLAHEELSARLKARSDSLRRTSTKTYLTRAEQNRLWDLLATSSQSMATAGPLTAQIRESMVTADYFAGRVRALTANEATRPAYVSGAFLPVLRDSSLKFVEAPKPGELDTSALRLKDYFVAPNPERVIRSIVVQLRVDAATPVESGFASTFVERLDLAGLRGLLAR